LIILRRESIPTVRASVMMRLLRHHLRSARSRWRSVPTISVVPSSSSSASSKPGRWWTSAPTHPGRRPSRTRSAASLSSHTWRWPILRNQNQKEEEEERVSSRAQQHLKQAKPRAQKTKNASSFSFAKNERKERARERERRALSISPEGPLCVGKIFSRSHLSRRTKEKARALKSTQENKKQEKTHRALSIIVVVVVRPVSSSSAVRHDVSHFCFFSPFL